MPPSSPITIREIKNPTNIFSKKGVGGIPPFTPLIYGQRGQILHGVDARRGQADDGKEGIDEEKNTQEKSTQGNAIIDLSDVPSEKQNTPRKETQGNDEAGDYIPTPPEDQEQNKQNGDQEEKEKGEDEMRSITSEQTEHTPKTVQSEADQKTAGESEAGQKEESENQRQRTAQEKVRRENRGRKEKPIRVYTHQTQQSCADKKPAAPDRPRKGKSHPNAPISSDLVSNISLSPSERSSAQTTEVPIDTETTAVSTPYEEQDETMAAKK